MSPRPRPWRRGLTRSRWMMTDPVYEGKSMRGLIDLMRKGYFHAGSRVRYVHIGEVSAINAYSSYLPWNG